MPSSSHLAPGAVARLIDHTILKPEATTADIDRLCEEATRNTFWSVCVNPLYVRHAAVRLRGTEVRVCSVVGFPLGASTTGAKVFETERAIEDGANEIDMVLRIGALRSGEVSAVGDDIVSVVEACHRGAALCKVILETALLNDEAIAAGCRLCVEAGADFVKTSTGFGPAGATEEHVALLAREVGGSGLGIKAAGGIRSYDDLLRMMEAGATRIGTSGGVRILEEARARGSL
jgi:deoxyribose-phosphate aldolase